MIIMVVVIIVVIVAMVIGVTVVTVVVGMAITFIHRGKAERAHCEHYDTDNKADSLFKKTMCLHYDSPLCL